MQKASNKGGRFPPPDKSEGLHRRFSMTKQFRCVVIFSLLLGISLSWGCATRSQLTENAKRETSSVKHEKPRIEQTEQGQQTPQRKLEITNVSVSKPSFNPTRGEDVRLSYSVSVDANVTVKVYDPDRYLAQDLMVDEFQQAGIRELIWDGRDVDGNIVPDQAYFFTIEAFQDSRQKTGDMRQETQEPEVSSPRSQVWSAGSSLENVAVYDPTIFSAGEEHDIADARFNWEANTVSFNLPKPSWVLGWGGIRRGPLVKIFLDWEPRPAGENIVFWDGKDQDGVADVSNHKDFVYRILTNTFPENSIIAIGNKGISYLEYKKQPGLLREKKPERPESLRVGVKFSSHAKLPRTIDRAPRFSVSFPDLKTRTEDGIPVLKGRTLIRVALDEADVDYITQFRYEIAFYVDYQLYAEEEEGISPFNWVWDPTGIPPGEHILTVNIVSLMGQIGVKNLKFIVEE